MTITEKLRATPSRSKRALLDEAAETIETLTSAAATKHGSGATNADHFRTMTDNELADFFELVVTGAKMPWDTLFEARICTKCPVLGEFYDKETGEKEEYKQCDLDLSCPYNVVEWWLQQPYEGIDVAATTNEEEKS